MRLHDDNGSREGVVVRTRWLRSEFVPFDEMTALTDDGTGVRTSQGSTFKLPPEHRPQVARALAPPIPTGRPTDDAEALSAYVSGWWSPTRAADALLSSAARAGASDVHLEDSGGHIDARFRIAGAMVPFLCLQLADGRRLTAALKHRAGCLPYRSDLVQEGRIPRDGVAADVRASFMPTALGERVALRLFGRLMQLPELGLDDAQHAELTGMLAHDSGLVLVAGPSGGGKTTTVYAALAHICALRGGAHLSIEDPVEQRLRLAGIPVDQVELDPVRGLTAEAALRGALRQDVDVVALSEVRLPSEAQLALQAAHTGRLVVAGLHAGSVTEARRRLLDLLSRTETGADEAIVDDTLRGVLHQRLVAMPCPEGPGCGPDCTTCFGARQRLRPRATTWTPRSP